MRVRGSIAGGTFVDSFSQSAGNYANLHYEPGAQEYAGQTQGQQELNQIDEEEEEDAESEEIKTDSTFNQIKKEKGLDEDNRESAEKERGITNSSPGDTKKDQIIYFQSDESKEEGEEEELEDDSIQFTGTPVPQFFSDSDESGENEHTNKEEA